MRPCIYFGTNVLESTYNLLCLSDGLRIMHSAKRMVSKGTFICEYNAVSDNLDPIYRMIEKIEPKAGTT